MTLDRGFNISACMLWLQMNSILSTRGAAVVVLARRRTLTKTKLMAAQQMADEMPGSPAHAGAGAFVRCRTPRNKGQGTGWQMQRPWVDAEAAAGFAGSYLRRLRFGRHQSKLAW